jgi:hypothetical protein
MAITVNWATKVINVPTSFLTLVSGGGGPGSLYELDVNALRLALKDIEDGEGMPYLDTHRHNSPTTLGGVTYARTFEIINGYTVKFDDTVPGVDHYTVRCAGANHNLADVKVLNTVSLIVGNSAGLIAVGGASPWTETIESGYTAAEILRLLAAVAAGKTTITDLGGGLAEVVFRDVNDVKPRITADMTGSERTAVVVDGT